MFVVTGATGNTGRRIAVELLENDHEVKVISRDRERLEDLVNRGGIPEQGDLRDQNFVEQALEEADSIYAMIPSDYSAENFREYQNEVINSLANSIEASGINHVVALSSLGARMDSGTGVVLGLHDMEERFRQIPETNVLFLRPGFFMENFYNQKPVILEQNMVAMAIREDRSYPLIHTRDIANYAVRRLQHRDFLGNSHQYLLGERNLTFLEATNILGRAIGEPDLQYVQVDYEDAKQAMMEQGMSEDVANRYNDLFRRINDETIDEDLERTPESTTQTPFEEFAEEFASSISK